MNNRQAQADKQASLSNRTRTAFRLFAADRFALLCATLVLFFVFFALAAPLLATQDPQDLKEIELADARLAPFTASTVLDRFHILGTDALGRDLFSMTLFGTQMSLAVAVCSAIGALIVGSLLGLAAAYIGGLFETLIMRLADVFLSLPAILVALVFISVFGRGVQNIILAILLAQWTHYARAMNVAARAEMKKEYVLAARLLRLSSPRIALGQILPNCVAPIMVIFAVQFGYVIAVEASLSFLGLGLPVTQPSLGSLVAEGQEYLLSGLYWISLIPGFILLMLVFSLNVVGDRIRRLQNPDNRQSEFGDA